MKFTTDFYEQRTEEVIDGDSHRLYVTDDTGAVWSIFTAGGGLRISPVYPLGRETVFIKPEASNVVVLQARDHGDTP